MICESGLLRIDLLGGTLDLDPINLIVPKCVTLNAAISLSAKVSLEKNDSTGVEIVSEDYRSKAFFDSSDFTPANFYNKYFQEFGLVAQILHFFGANRGLKLSLASDSPPGAGLGGSSALGIALFRALSILKEKDFPPLKSIEIVRAIEGRTLSSGPTGYQDYYPAVYGGILALFPHPGEIEVCQLYGETLKQFLQNHLTLVNSGQLRHSGMCNWEVYKGLFDGDKKIRQALEKIAELAHQSFESLKSQKLMDFLELMAEEGRVRTKLFPNIVTPQMLALQKLLEREGVLLGLKVCGAGGGGCFLLAHQPEYRPTIIKAVESAGMKTLPFSIAAPQP